MASLHPRNGARVVLERVLASGPGEGDGARYRVTIYEPGEVSHAASARLSPEVELGEWSTPPPEWTRAFVGRLLKTLATKHADGSWPRKVTRWRERT